MVVYKNWTHCRKIFTIEDENKGKVENGQIEDI